MDGISFLFLHVDYILLKLPISKEVSEQHRMRERKSESLSDSWNNEMIVTEHLTIYKLHIWSRGKDGRFRDTVFIMFNPFKNKNIWGGRVASQCCRRNLTFSQQRGRRKTKTAKFVVKRIKYKGREWGWRGESSIEKVNSTEETVYPRPETMSPHDRWGPWFWHIDSYHFGGFESRNI